MRKIVKYLDEHIKSIILIGIVLIIFLLSTIYFPSRARYTRLDDGALVVQATAVIKRPPILTISYSDNEITKDDILVTIESNEEIKQPTGWTISSDKKTITKTYTENVNETLGVYDLYDNKTDAVIEINNIDKTKPVITSSFFPLKTSSTSVSVNLKWTENDMVTEYCISDSDSSCTNWVTIESPSNTKTSITTTYTLPNSEAKYTRYAFVKDRAGNISEAKSDYVFYDNTNPTITITRTDYNTFSWSASDANGISGYKVTTTSETPTSWVTGGTLTSGTYDIGTDSKYYVHVKDAAGNTSYDSIDAYTITKDIAEGASLLLKENNSSGTTITSAARVLSGTQIYILASVSSGYSLSSVLVDGSSITNGSTRTISKNTTIEITTSVNKPTTPTITASDSKTSGSWHTANFDLSFASTITSGNITYYYGTSTSSMTSTGSSVSITTATSSKTYYVKACNSVNTSVCSSIASYTVKLDKTDPTITISRSDYNTFTWSASDTNGITGYKVTTSSALPTSWTTSGTLASGTYDIGTDSKYYVHVKDAAGNTNYSSINTYQLTKTEGTGTTLTIKENSSSGTTITSSTRVLNNTVIYVSVAAKSGYENAKVTIAGSAFTSGGTYTINSSVEVKSSATVSDSEDPTVTISLSDYNTFSWSARDNKAVTGYAVTTSNSTPTSWTTSGTLTSGTYNIDTNTSYYVYAKDAAGNIGYAKIDAYKITKSQGLGTTLTIKENNASGTTLTGSTLYVLSGTKLYITGSTSTGYCSGTYKIGSTSFASAVTHTVSASVTISSSASYCVPSQPTITASDGKGSSTWHNSSFTLTFSSTISSGSVKYYYSNSPLSQTNEASSLSISAATQTSFYVKACNALDTSVCSSVAYYAAKLDSSPPGISSLGGKDTDTITVTATDTPAGIMGYCFAKSQSSCSANSSFGSSNTKTFSSSSDAGTWYVCVRDNASNDNCVSFQVDTATEQGEFSQSKYDTCVDNYTGGQGINSYCSKQYENASSQCNKDCVDPCKSSCNGGADGSCMAGCMGNCVPSCMKGVGDSCTAGIENGCKSQAYETITIYKVNY